MLHDTMAVHLTTRQERSRRPHSSERPAAKALFMAALFFAATGAHLASGADTAHNRAVHVIGGELQGAIDAAQPGDTVIADPNHLIIVDETITVEKPLAITGLHVKMIDGLDNTPIILVTADGFRLNNFHIIGNRETVEHQNRASLVVIEANDFVVEQGIIEESSEHGIEISANGRHVKNGVVRDIVGHNMGRDHVSLQGTGEDGFYVKNVVVERLRAYGSTTRGAVEVADGNTNVVVRDIYAEDCRYGVDFQDHVKQGMGQRNLRVIIENVFVRRCSHAVRSATAAGMGHRNLTIRNISGEDWVDGSGEGKMAQPIVVNHVDNVLIDNVDIMGNGETIYAGFLIMNSNNVKINNITLDHVSVYREAILIENCSDVHMNNAYVDAEARVEGENVALRYRLNSEGVYDNLRINNLVAKGPVDRVVLEALEPIGDYREYHKRRFTGERMQFGPAQADVALLNYVINYDPALIDDQIGVENAHVRTFVN